jgi:hypothetical protein
VFVTEITAHERLLLLPFLPFLPFPLPALSYRLASVATNNFSSFSLPAPKVIAGVMAGNGMDEAGASESGKSASSAVSLRVVPPT